MGMDMFFSPSEKDHLAEWSEEAVDRSLIGRAFSGFFDWLAGYVPEEVAPSVITLAGSFAVFQAWYLSESYGSLVRPEAVSFVAAAFVVLFWVSRDVACRHAAQSMMDTAVTRLFGYACDLVSAVFLTNVLCGSLLSFGLEAQWFCVQTVQQVFLLKHYWAWVRGDGLRYFIIGPGEVLALVVVTLATRGAYGVGRVQAAFNFASGFYGGALLDARTVCLAVFCILFARITMSCGPAGKISRSGKVLGLVLALRAFAGVMRVELLLGGPVTKGEVIADGLFMSVITCDVIAAKMSGRELSPSIVLMTGMVMVPGLHLLALAFAAFYYAAVFWELSSHLGMPLLRPCRNVYCDGIYDLCHIGHKNVFRNAAKLGDRLFVGVVGDADANSYKRPPVMSAAEREAEVLNCKCVTKVIKEAPCFGLTLDYIKEHRIHVVAFGQEYLDRFPDPEDDPYYKVPRKMGIARPMPRTDGLSTSDLIMRIQSRGADEKKSPT